MKARVVIGVAVCLALVALLVLSNAGEPSYNGRSLSSWLRQCDLPLDQDKQIKEAQSAVRAIGAEKVLPRLLALIKTKDSRMRTWLVEQSEKYEGRFFQYESATALQLQGIAGFEALGTNASPAVGELAGMLGDKELAFVAARCLEHVGKAAEATLCRCLTNQDWEVRRLAVTGLSSVTDDAEVYIARIKGRLSDSETAVRYATVNAIGAQTDAPDLAVPILTGLLEELDDGVVCEAIAAIARFGTNAAGVFPQLTNFAGSGGIGRASAALRALPEIAPAAALPVLSNAVINGHSDTLRVALRSLKTIAPDLARELMLAQFHSTDPRRRTQAVSVAANYSVTTPGIAAALKSAAVDDDTNVARRAAIAMRQMLEKQKEATGHKLLLPGEPLYQGRPLGEWLTERRQPGGELSTNAMTALKAMGTNAFPALLARVAYREPVFGLADFDVRVEAVSAFICLREEARPALPALAVLMDSDDPQLALLAMLATLGTGAEAAPCLMKGLTNRFADVRNEAAGQFTDEWGKQFPELRRQGMPLLVKLLDDPDQNVRNSVSNGLKYLDQEPPARIHQH